MDKPTEHQPLDNLFRRKLNDASVQPDTEGWARLESRLTGQEVTVEDKPTRRLGAVWYWSASVAAACLLLAFLWTGPTKQPTAGTGKSDLAVIPETSRGTTQTPTKRQTPVLSETETDKLAERSSETVDPIINPQNRQAREAINRPYDNSAKVLESQAKTEIRKSELTAKTLDKQADERTIQLELPEKDAVVANNAEPATKPALQNTERTLIVTVAEPATAETASPQTENALMPREAPVKNARIARVFRQIKRLKDGEALARADINPDGTDDESGLVSRLVQATRSKENQIKQQK